VPHDRSAGKPGRIPGPGEIDVIGLMPLLSPYFRPSLVHEEMPARLRAVFDAQRLTPRHGAVLPQLLAPAPLTVGELAQRLRLSLSTASELVGALARAGLVERTVDPANRRRTIVTLAPEHRGDVEQFIAARSAPLLRALDGLSPRDRDGFLAGLTAWAREIQGRPFPGERTAADGPGTDEAGG